MSHPEIVRSKEPIRLFASPFLEFFTHVHPAVVLIIWVPVVIYFLVRAVLTRAPGSGWVYIPLAFLIGVFLWTLAEYMLHRYLFHYSAHTPWQERMIFLLHGVHHAQPMIKTRLVMPPAVSVPFAALFYALFWLILGVLLGAPAWVAPLFAGFLTGYIAYDMTHYALHHLKARTGYYAFLRRHHMRHHQVVPVGRFGVSSPLWDRVFGTEPAE
jgi:sterol desaturase/sphingolipid hydroxylase (fatty acid hydroxylase superfamily)